MNLLIGIHPVREALKAGRSFDRVLIAKGAGGPRLQEIIDLCRRQGVVVRFESRSALDRAAPNQAHQGVVGYAAAAKYAGLDDITGDAKLVLVLDGVEDPQNLGAVVRTANAAGVAAVIIPERRAAGLTDVVAKAAAGALEYTPVVRVSNIVRALDELKKRGFWIYGLDERGKDEYHRVEYATPTVFVMGAEARGLHQLVRENCDLLLRIPMEGTIPSLNVSVATGIVLFEWKRRQRTEAGSLQ